MQKAKHKQEEGFVAKPDLVGPLPDYQWLNIYPRSSRPQEEGFAALSVFQHVG